MDLWATIKVLFRRWLLVVPVLVIGFAVTMMVVNKMPAVYRSQARLLLLAPAVEKGSATDPDALVPVNPFMRFGGGQEFSTNVIQDLMNSDSTRKELHASGLSDTWTIA